MQNKIIFILTLALLVVVVLLWRSCQSTKSVPDTRNKTVDSIVKKAISDSIVFSHFSDSLQNENVLLSIKNDSLTTAISLTKYNLHQKGNNIEELINQYNDAKTERDSVLALNKCDSLVGQVTGAKALVFLYENQNDSLQNVFKKLLANRDTLINRISGLYAESNSSLFEVSRLYNLQSSDLKKAQKNAGKRWGIGPLGGIGIADSKIVPIVGVGITYNLFKF